ncbi:MAG: nitroreductase family protein [Candidatus Glassbacteria bacterium]|nr:nitroreductase family protein [Candidatus Glassbacteria bacterium]
MDAMEALKSRRSIRSYRTDPVEKEKVEAAIDAARLAATGHGVEPWEFVVVTNNKIRAQLAEICDYGKFIVQAPVCVVVLCRDTKYYLEDGSAATQNMMVAACAQGLGSCWVAGDKKSYAEKIVRLVGAPPEYKLVSLVSLGLPADDHPPRRSKRSLDEVIHWEKF